MTISPQCLLSWAENQPKTDETDYRACISRAYYAAYHDCKRFHDSLPSPGAGASSGGVHEDLCHRLIHTSPETKKDQQLNERSQKRVAFLRPLKHKRGIADYELNETISLTDAANIIAKAKLIMSI